MYDVHGMLLCLWLLMLLVYAVYDVVLDLCCAQRAVRVCGVCCGWGVWCVCGYCVCCCGAAVYADDAADGAVV